MLHCNIFECFKIKNSAEAYNRNNSVTVRNIEGYLIVKINITENTLQDCMLGI